MVLIVIPALNEEKKVGRVIRGLFERGFKNVVVVDDGSSDMTADEAEKAGAIVLRHKINRGQGASLETGDEYARSIGVDVVVHFDADDQFNPDDIKAGVDLIESGSADVVLGSRFLDGRSQIPWFKKYILLKIARWINYVFTGIVLSDAHNGFRIMNRKALLTIKFTHDRMAHNTEILRLIKKNKLNFCEIPVEVKYSRYGQGLYGGVKIIYDLIIGSFTS